MKKLAVVSVVLFIACALTGSVVAGEKAVTLEGKMICAKCNLKVEEFTKCQNVVAVVKDGETSHYYLAKNEANTEFGDVCLAEKQVRVTGTVSEKDGRTWIAASKIEVIKSEG